MKTLLRVVLWAASLAAFLWLLTIAEEHDREDCEVRIAQELGTTARYLNGHCLVKGYGRFDGR